MSEDINNNLDYTAEYEQSESSKAQDAFEQEIADFYRDLES